MEAPSSQVEIAECYIDTSDEVIWITPVVKETYESNMLIAITTRYMAVQNPISQTSVNLNQF